MLKTIGHQNSVVARYRVEIILYLWLTMKIKQINTQTNKNKAKLKFYERIKVFLSKKRENTNISYHPMGTGRLMDVFFHV